MRIRIWAVLVAVIAVLATALYIQHSALTKARKERDRQALNVRTLTNEARALCVRDSLRAAQVTALVLKRGELEELRARDAKLIKDLRLRLRDVRGVTTVTSVYHDTVFLHVAEDAQENDILTYADDWADIAFCRTDSSVTYSFRDSITTIQHLAYRKKFLWWRWDPETRITVINHNPRCTLITGVVSIVNDE